MHPLTGHGIQLRQGVMEYIQADGVGHDDGADRVPAAEAHGSVHILLAGVPVLDHRDRMVEVAVQQASGDEPRSIGDLGHGTTGGIGECRHIRDGSVRGQDGANDLGQRALVGGQGQVQPDEPTQGTGGECQLSHGQDRCGGHEGGIGGSGRHERSQHLLLGRGILRGGFDDQLAAVQRGDPTCDTTHDLEAGVGGELRQRRSDRALPDDSDLGDCS